MKINKLLIILAVLFLNITIFAQTQFTVTYNREHAASGTDDIQTLSYKDGIAVFNFYQKKEKKKIDFYEVENRFRKYISCYNLKDKTILEQHQLEDGTLLLAKWKHDLKWEILEETKEINGYTVQKAITQSYNGDEDDFGIATAWFTTEIPVGIGPLRYHGLPGLVLELSFERYGLTYTMTKIDFDKPVVIPKLDKGIAISKEQSIDPDSISKKFLKNEKKKKEKKDNKPWWQIWD